VQALGIEVAFIRKPQDAPRKLIRPHFIVPIVLERQPGFVKRGLQHRERLRTKGSASKSPAKAGAECTA
jgi:hypothetical protein